MKALILTVFATMMLVTAQTRATEVMPMAVVGKTQESQKGLWGGVAPDPSKVSMRGIASVEDSSGSGSSDTSSTPEVTPSPTPEPIDVGGAVVRPSAPGVASCTDCSPVAKIRNCVTMLSAELVACNESSQIGSSEKLLPQCVDQKVALYKSCLKER